jgi:ligand-binding SRPBCC domain-containing protein
MPVATFSTTLPVSSTDAFAWHARAGAFDRLTPPWLRLRAEQQLAPGATSIIENGGLVQLTFHKRLARFAVTNTRIVLRRALMDVS